MSGLGVWPKLVTPDYFMRHHGGKIPRGLLAHGRAGGTRCLDQALAALGHHELRRGGRAATRFAKEGFAAHPLLCETITTHRKAYEEWPSNRAIYLPNGRPPKPGEMFVQSDLAKSLQYMIDQEQAAAAGAARLAWCGPRRLLHRRHRRPDRGLSRADRRPAAHGGRGRVRSGIEPSVAVPSARSRCTSAGRGARAGARPDAAAGRSHRLSQA